jgi:PLAT/LH2 domain
MKILSIGPEGAGKTVFLTMLTGYMSDRSRPLPIHVETFQAAEKIEGFKETLKSGDWPPSNIEGDPHEIFTFRLGSAKGKRIHLWDFPGQHFRKSTIDPTTPDPLGHLKRLRETIEEAHILIYLLDMGGLLNPGKDKKVTEDAWLFREFLTNSKWKNRQRLVVVTKADRYRGLLAQAGEDPRRMIVDAWPDGIVACPLTPDSFPDVDFFAITSVKVKNVIGEDRVPYWIPSNPLESEGFEPLLKRIFEGLKGGWWTKTKNAVLVGQRGVKKGTKAIVSLGKLLPRKIKLFVILVLSTLLALGIWHSSTDTYEFQFATGEKSGAGTDASVEFSLIGKDGRVSSTTLGQQQERLDTSDPFERNQTSVFERRMASLGEIKAVSIKLADAGNKPAWFLNWVRVTNKDTGVVSTFSFHDWLGSDSFNPGSHPWEVTLTAGDLRL